MSFAQIARSLQMDGAALPIRWVELTQRLQNSADDLGTLKHCGSDGWKSARALLATSLKRISLTDEPWQLRMSVTKRLRSDLRSEELRNKGRPRTLGQTRRGGRHAPQGGERIVQPLRHPRFGQG